MKLEKWNYNKYSADNLWWFVAKASTHGRDNPVKWNEAKKKTSEMK